MPKASDYRIDIVENGRAGSVLYRELAGTLSFYWEFGGGDTLAIIQVEDPEAWKAGTTWADNRREEILRIVADELIRQKSPTSRAEIDQEAGTIVLLQRHRSSRNTTDAVAFVRRFSRLKSMLGIAVLVLTLMFGCMMWLKNNVFTIDPGKGTPIGFSIRTDRHIATLIQTLEPYMPSLNRDHSKNKYRISLFLVPLDGSEPKLIPIKGGLSPNSLGLAKVLGSDGNAIWFDAAGMGAVNLKTYKLLPPTELRKPPPKPKQPGVMALGPKIEHHLAAGMFVGQNKWLGLHSKAEAERDFKPNSGLKRVVHAEDIKQTRRFHLGTLEPVDPISKYYPIESMKPLGEEEYLNAAFLRLDDTSEPLRLNDPDSALMIYTSIPGLTNTTIVARVDTAGKTLWKADTGIDRFHLHQVLPGENSLVFVGTKSPEPSKVSEPLLVIVENNTGKVSTYSLWQ